MLPDCGVHNLTSDWNSGINLSALLDYCQPGLFSNWRELDPSDRCVFTKPFVLLWLITRYTYAYFWRVSAFMSHGIMNTSVRRAYVYFTYVSRILYFLSITKSSTCLRTIINEPTRQFSEMRADLGIIEMRKKTKNILIIRQNVEIPADRYFVFEFGNKCISER